VTSVDREDGCYKFVSLNVFFVVCSFSVRLSAMDEDPNQLIEAPEDDDINDLNDETFGSFVGNCRHSFI